jgi:hypothetical protein
MKALCAIAAVGLTLMGYMGSASAQPYGGRYYEDRGRDYEYRERGPRYRERDYEYEERGPRHRGRGYAFDEREYLRCNPDVRAAVYPGGFSSGFQHYQRHGRREGRRLTC